LAQELIAQEMSAEKWIEIPQAVQDIYDIWRPSPLVRATGLEKALKTPARIYFKDESHSPPGSHKPNTAVPQAYYNKMEGINRLSTETGAGQWGSALSFACAQFDMECKVYMVKCSYEQKPYRRSMMHVWGGKVTPSPSTETAAGRQILAADPDCPGTLGIAISEAVEAAVAREDTKYTLGSVLNHVMLHQTVMGLEAEKQFEIFEDTPDIVRGLHRAMASRTLGLVKRVAPRLSGGEVVAMSGGVARNPGAVRALEQALGLPIQVPAEPDTVGALGAALVARDRVS